MKILVGSHEDRLFVLQHNGLQMLTEVLSSVKSSISSLCISYISYIVLVTVLAKSLLLSS